MKQGRIRVLYDGSGFNEVHGGVSRYFTELIKYLPSEIDPRLSLDVSCNKYLQLKPFEVLPNKHAYCNFLRAFEFRGKWRIYSTLTHVPLLSRFFVESINDLAARRELIKGDYDIVHFTGPHDVGTNWSLIYGRKPFVITVHDLIPEKISFSVELRRNRIKIMNAAAHIIAVSEATKRDLLDIYKVKAEKVTVIHHGYTQLEGYNAAINGFADFNYLLYVGKRSGYKNFSFFLDAIAPLLRNSGTVHLVCVGTDFSFAERRQINALKIKGQVHQVSISDELLKMMYAKAICLIYPSLYEGFGLPVLEAMDNGCPVIASDIPALREVAADAALYFELYNPSDLLEKVNLVICNAGERERMIRQGRTRSREFSWLEAARKTAQVYKDVLDQG